MSTYRIVRFYQDGEREVVQTGLTLDEARAHCNDPETSSATATSMVAAARTARKGAWFDGFNEED
jgi:hypothetical protein